MPAATVEQVSHAGANIIAVDSTKMAPTAIQGKQVVLSKASQRLLDIEAQYTVGGFTPLPGFMDSGKGAKLWVRKQYHHSVLSAAGGVFRAKTM